MKWKSTLCEQGEECWCRIIEPAEPILHSDTQKEYYVVGSGSIPKLEAEHLVELHNKSL